jgi:small conductance mechanosensitive channel
LFVALGIISFLWSGGSLVGQSSDANGASLKQAAGVLIDDLRARGEALRELQEKVAASDGERRAIYRTELLRRWTGFGTKLDELVENVVQQQAKGIDPADQLVAASDMTSSVAAGLSDAALAREAALAKLEDRRAEATGADKSTLEREARRESTLYHALLEAIVDNIARMKKLGIDATEASEQADRLLRERATYLEGRLELLLANRTEVRELLRGALEGEKEELQKELRSLNGRASSTADGLRAVLDQMDRVGIDTTASRAILLKAAREVDPGSLDARATAGLLQQWLSEGRSWVRANGSNMIVRLLVVLLILLAFLFLSKVAAKVVRAGVRSSRVRFSRLLQEFFVLVAARVVLAIGFLIALSQMGINLAPLLAGLGIAGFVIGFAMQDSLSNFASGLMILIYRPYDVGDSVEVAGALGVVSEMSLVSTTIKTFDNQKLIVPNSKIWGDVIRNLTAETTRRVDLVFGISYGDDIAKAERLMMEEIEKHELVLEEPPPVIKVHALGDSSVNFVVRPWVKTENYWAVFWDLTRSIKLRFDQEGITIPFPQRDVYLHKDESESHPERGNASRQ